jgi:hypothetical protein
MVTVVVIPVQLLQLLVETTVLCARVRLFVKFLVQFIKILVEPLVGTLSSNTSRRPQRGCQNYRTTFTLKERLLYGTTVSFRPNCATIPLCPCTKMGHLVRERRTFLEKEKPSVYEERGEMKGLEPTLLRSTFPAEPKGTGKLSLAARARS